MKVTKLQVRNFEGLEQLDIEPADQITRILGHNGAGKTSVLDALRVAFTNSRTRAKLVYDDADSGTILFELDDGTQGERSVFDSGRTAGPLDLRDADGRSIGAAQKFLNKLGLGFGFNPLEFIDLRADKQTQQLLEITPVDVKLPELLQLSGGQVPYINYRQHPLLVIKEIEKHLEEKRREAGRSARDVEGMVTRLREEVPQDFDRVAAQEQDLSNLMSEYNEITTTAREMDRLTARGEKIAAEITQLRAQIVRIEQRIKKLQEEEQECFYGIDEFSQLDLRSFTEVQAEIAAYKQNQAYLTKLQEADNREREAEDLRVVYSALNDQVAAVRAKPGQLLASTELPVEGLGIDDDGQVTINSLPIASLSTGEQLDTATDIAIATLGELRVVLVDGLEKLDSDHADRMLSRLATAGVQAFVTKVDDCELTVITDVLNIEDEIPF